MDDLMAWLAAQLDGDERAAGGGVHTAFCVNDVRYPEECQCGWSARVLREVEAKRRILADIAQYVADDEAWDAGSPETDGLAVRVLDYLALPYADREGYRPEWKP